LSAAEIVNVAPATSAMAAKVGIQVRMGYSLSSKVWEY
jgi:hypothetical protein